LLVFVIVTIHGHWHELEIVIDAEDISCNVRAFALLYSILCKVIFVVNYSNFFLSSKNILHLYMTGFALAVNDPT